MFQNVTQYIYRLIPRHTVRKLQCGKGRRGLPNTPSDSGWGGGYVGSATHSERYQGRELELWYSLPSFCTPPSPPLAPVCVSRLSSLQTYCSRSRLDAFYTPSSLIPSDVLLRGWIWRIAAFLITPLGRDFFLQSYSLYTRLMYGLRVFVIKNWNGCQPTSKCDSTAP